MQPTDFAIFTLQDHKQNITPRCIVDGVKHGDNFMDYSDAILIGALLSLAVLVAVLFCLFSIRSAVWKLVRLQSPEVDQMGLPLPGSDGAPKLMFSK